MVIKRGKSKSEKVLLQCHFIHHESHLKSPGIETTNSSRDFVRLLGRRRGPLQVLYLRGENVLRRSVTYVPKDS
jgi:hypothetical protein